MTPLHVLSAGAAQGFVTALAAERGVTLQAEFGAVGAMKKRLDEGAPCDLIILTRAMIDALGVPQSADLGRVRTAIAVRAADAAPDVSTAQALKAALEAADELYFPDPQKATAGIHFAKVLEQLGIGGTRRTFPNGATAMREMARSTAKRPIGCTQASEILNTPGTRLVAPLPAGLELETVYAAALAPGARNAALAKDFLQALSSEASAALRRKAGFEP